MGSVPAQLAAELARHLGIHRAVETGTYLGEGTRRLTAIFASVHTIELSEELARLASERLSDVPNVGIIRGDSRAELPRLADPTRATFFFLDGHWSAGSTAGQEAECPLLAELEALRLGHPSDCVVVDDVRLLLAPPPPPHDAGQWPTFMEVWDTLRQTRPDHFLTVVDDQLVAVPFAGKDVVDRYGVSIRNGVPGGRPSAPSAV